MEISNSCKSIYKGFCVNVRCFPLLPKGLPINCTLGTVCVCDIRKYGETISRLIVETIYYLTMLLKQILLVHSIYYGCLLSGYGATAISIVTEQKGSYGHDDTTAKNKSKGQL